MYKHVYTHLANCSVISFGIVPLVNPEPVFLNVYGAQESILRNDSASLCSLAGQYDNPILTRFLAPIDCLKIPALVMFTFCLKSLGILQ
jgi:hypothetical protein